MFRINSPNKKTDKSLVVCSVDISISGCSKPRGSENLTVVESETSPVACIADLPPHYYDSPQGLNTSERGGGSEGGAHDGGMGRL